MPCQTISRIEIESQCWCLHSLAIHKASTIISSNSNTYPLSESSPATTITGSTRSTALWKVAQTMQLSHVRQLSRTHSAIPCASAIYYCITLCTTFDNDNTALFIPGKGKPAFGLHIVLDQPPYFSNSQTFTIIQGLKVHAWL